MWFAAYLIWNLGFILTFSLGFHQTRAAVIYKDFLLTMISAEKTVNLQALLVCKDCHKLLPEGAKVVLRPDEALFFLWSSWFLIGTTD